MPVLDVAKSPQVAYAPGGPVLIANADIVHPVYAALDSKPNASEVQIPPLGSVTLADGARWFLSTLDDSVTVGLHVFPGGSSWAPSPYLIAQQAQLLGTPPYVPGLASRSLERQGPSGGGVFYTFTAQGRIWGASVDLSIASSGTYAAGTTSSCYARVRVAGATTLAITGVAIGNNSDQDSNGSDRDFPGLLANVGDQLVLDVNGGSTVTDAVITADCTVLFSVP